MPQIILLLTFTLLLKESEKSTPWAINHPLLFTCSLYSHDQKLANQKKLTRFVMCLQCYAQLCCKPLTISPMQITLGQNWHVLRAALHLEAGPIPLEADCMKFQPFWGWRPASTKHYNKIIMGANFPICKGLRAKKLGWFNKSSIIQLI